MEVNTQTMIFLYILVVVVQGQQVAMSVQSTGYPPHLYRDEPIAVTCTATGYTATESVTLVDGTVLTDPYYGCVYSSGAWDRGGDASDFPWLTVIDNTYCATAGAQSPPFTLSLEGQVSEAMVGLNLNCLAYLDGSTVLSTDSVPIPEIRVVPPGPPTLSISGDEPKIAEGKPFTFSCSPSTASPGAQPTSEYSYEVLRNGVVIANTNTYTPVQADRDGIKLRCTDNVHYDALKNKYPDRVVNETDPLYSWYLVNNGEENRDTEMQPSADYTLTCDVSGYPGEQITYSWSCDGCTSTDTTLVLVVPNGPRTSGQTETISCTASLPPLAPVTITWNITWSSDAPLPTEGPDSTTVFAYLVNNGEENIATQLNPSAEHPLTCDVSGYPEDNIAYIWSCDGCTSTDTASVLVVPNRPRTSGQTETISCTANIPPLAPVTITWTVTWSSDSTLPTEGPDSTTVPASKTTPNAPAIALGVIAGLLTIALLVVSLLFWNYRRNVGNNGGMISSNRREQHEHALNQMELNASQRGKGVGVTSGDRGDNYTSLDTSRREEHAYAAVGDGDMQGYEVMDLGQPARVILAQMNND